MTRHDSIDVATFLGNVATETGRLHDVATRLDMLLGDIAGADGLMSAHDMARLQEMDHLRQALGALSTLSLNGAELVRAGRATDMPKTILGEGVTLEAVRLACIEGPGPVGVDTAVDPGQSASATVFF